MSNPPNGSPEHGRTDFVRSFLAGPPTFVLRRPPPTKRSTSTSSSYVGLRKTLGARSRGLLSSNPLAQRLWGTSRGDRRSRRIPSPLSRCCSSPVKSRFPPLLSAQTSPKMPKCPRAELPSTESNSCCGSQSLLSQMVGPIILCPITPFLRKCPTVILHI